MVWGPIDLPPPSSSVGLSSHVDRADGIGLKTDSVRSVGRLILEDIVDGREISKDGGITVPTCSWSLVGLSSDSAPVGFSSNSAPVGFSSDSFSSGSASVGFSSDSASSILKPSAEESFSGPWCDLRSMSVGDKGVSYLVFEKEKREKSGRKRKETQ